jgi:hypothetical protein
VSLLLCFLTLVIQGFASWTVAYHFVLLARLPMRVAIGLFAAILLCLVTCTWKQWQPAFRSAKRQWRSLVALLTLASVAGVASLLVDNFNPDDYNFFHRALVQLDHLDQPVLLTETGLAPPGLPPLSMLHVLTSYEPAVACVARGLGVDPLQAYHNGAAMIGVVLLVVVLALLNRHFGMGPGTALAAAGMSLLYLLSDARLPRSYGNILLYCWIGKTLLWGVLLPATLLLALRFLRRPTVGRFTAVALAVVCAPGLSGSGLFLAPALLASAGLAYLAAGRRSSRRVSRVALLGTAAFYCLAIALLASLGVIPRPANIDVWTAGWPTVWWRNLGLVFNQPAVILRDALLVVVIPWFALPRPLARLAVLFCAASCLLVANPVTGPMWVHAVTPAAYWRLVFLLPLGWYAGLLVAAAIRRRPAGFRAIASRAVVVASLLVLVVAWRHSVLWPGRVGQFPLKSPAQLRLPRTEADFARLAAPYLHGHRVLGPETVCLCIALLDPSVRFEALRGTEHIFANAGNREEGLRRMTVQTVLTAGDREWSGDEVASLLRPSLAGDVEALVFADVAPVRRRLAPLLGADAGGTWQCPLTRNGYALLLRTKE